jgi:co-chaperonin GroES (HSP10)
MTLPLAMFDNVIVDVSHAVAAGKEKVSEGGIILKQEVTPEIPTDGLVVGVGPDCKIIQVGMRVCLPLNAGAMRYLDWKGKDKEVKYTIMSEKSIPAVFE